mgnify:CR=1 FL=1
MMRFTFTDNTRFLPDPNDSIYQLETKVDQLHELPPKEQLSLLYNDATNYLNADLTPYEAWYQKRIRAVKAYAGLDWLALGQHLNLLNLIGDLIYHFLALVLTVYTLSCFLKYFVAL